MSSHCDEALDRILEFLDDELPPDRLREVAEHLEGCPPCEAEYRIHERIKSMVANCPQEAASEELRARIRAVVSEARGSGERRS